MRINVKIYFNEFVTLLLFLLEITAHFTQFAQCKRTKSNLLLEKTQLDSARDEAKLNLIFTIVYSLCLREYIVIAFTIYKRVIKLILEFALLLNKIAFLQYTNYNMIYKWAQENKMPINISKYVHLSIGNLISTDMLNGTPILNVNQYTHLGIQIECDFRRPARDFCARSVYGRAGRPWSRADIALFILQTQFQIQN